MKKSILICILLLSVSITVRSQDIPKNNIPQIVISTFTLKFPDAKDVEWALENNTYHADFKIGSMEHEAWIGSNGILSAYKSDIKLSELPEPVRVAVKTDFPGFRIQEAEKKDEDGTLSYVVELKNAGKEWHAVYAPDGRLISKTEDD